MATLEELIDQQIALGRKNPHEFFERLEYEVGDDLIEIVRPYIADFISEMARQRLNTMRRADVARITTENSQNKDIMLHSLWVPDADRHGIHYKRIADMTADDFDGRAEYLEQMSAGIASHAAWCRDIASMIRDQNVKTAGKLKALPQLHAIES